MHAIVHYTTGILPVLLSLKHKLLLKKMWLLVIRTNTKGTSAWYMYYMTPVPDDFTLQTMRMLQTMRDLSRYDYIFIN